jgi:hypothetical protein
LKEDEAVMQILTRKKPNFLKALGGSWSDRYVPEETEAQKAFFAKLFKASEELRRLCTHTFTSLKRMRLANNKRQTDAYLCDFLRLGSGERETSVPVSDSADV